MRRSFSTQVTMADSCLSRTPSACGKRPVRFFLLLKAARHNVLSGHWPGSQRRFRRPHDVAEPDIGSREYPSSFASGQLAGGCTLVTSASFAHLKTQRGCRRRFDLTTTSRNGCEYGPDRMPSLRHKPGIACVSRQQTSIFSSCRLVLQTNSLKHMISVSCKCRISSVNQMK